MQFIKKFIPEKILKAIRPYYHGLVALLASWYFRRPSRKMIVIGITGTTGKSTTVQLLARILNRAGKKAGFVTTVSFFDGQTEQINKHGLSMPGGWLLQFQLQQMLKNGCQYALVECTSEGLAQNRHWGVEFDLAVLTNLSEAHLETHGGFKKYREAKARLFESLAANRKSLTSTAIVINGDDGGGDYFLSFQADRKLVAGFGLLRASEGLELFGVQNPDWQNQTFELSGAKFNVRLLGKFNLYNAALAAVTAFSQGVSFLESADAVSTFEKIRGRMESVPNIYGVTILVDYGCEPASLRAALEAAGQLPHNRLLHVFGATGGHRDKQKRFLFGQISAKYSDEIIITNDDVYDSDPEEIARNIMAGVKQNSKFFTHPERCQVILDRRSAITKALKMAQRGDIVLLTGKGSEQFLILPGNKRVAWDEASVVNEELRLAKS